MNELSNTAEVSGEYNGVSTSLMSNVSVVNMVDGLTFKKEADKKNWATGNLKYTFTISNLTDTAYVNPVIKDVLDTSLVSYVEDSVYINGVQASGGEASYDDASKTLTITLDKVAEQSTTTVTFEVKKKTQ